MHRSRSCSRSGCRRRSINRHYGYRRKYRGIRPYYSNYYTGLPWYNFWRPSYWSTYPYYTYYYNYLYPYYTYPYYYQTSVYDYFTNPKDNLLDDNENENSLYNPEEEEMEKKLEDNVSDYVKMNENFSMLFVLFMILLLLFLYIKKK